MITLENESIIVQAIPRGAELINIFNKRSGLYYLWYAGPEWPKYSPVLFPIVGTLKQDQYYYDDKPYKLPRHGFAREKDFIVDKQTSTSVTFSLKADENTRINYPFDFKLDITYTIDGDRLSVKYDVSNLGSQKMFFSLGAHPAFRVPLEPGLNYHDYQLKFEKEESVNRWPISPDGLIMNESIPVLQSTNILPLNKSLFINDALVFKDLKSRSVQLISSEGSAGLEFEFEGFPYLGLWAAKNADFICIEPWCGIADGVNSNQQFESKEGINSLNAKETFTRTWSVRTF